MGRRIQITESQLRYIIENVNRIDEQKSPATTTQKQGIQTNMGRGKVGAPEKKKVSDEDISNMSKDIMANDIKEIVAEKKGSISDDQAKKASAAFIDRALVDKKYGKLFKTGLINDSLHLNVWHTYQDQMAVGSAIPAKEIVVTAKGDGKEAPQLKLYNDKMEPFKTFGTDDELASYVNGLNIKLFSEGSEEQYYLYSIKDGKVIHAKNADQLMIAKKSGKIQSTPTLNIVGPSTVRGGATAGKTIKTDPTKSEVELMIDLSEAFPTEVAQLDDAKVQKLFGDKIKAELQRKGIGKFEAKQINIVSSASNSWNKQWVAPTHSKSGQLLGGQKDSIGKDVPAVKYNFHEQPPSGTDDTAKNNNLAWQRGQNLLKAIAPVETEFYTGKGASPTVNWRVTDTGGKVDKPGHEGSGQYAKIYIKGSVIITTPGEEKELPGENVGALSQRLIYLTSMAAKGGKRTISWFSAHKAKYIGKGGKPLAQPRTTGGISGLPNWLDKIIGYQ